jgi:hypothetical protein
MLDCSEVSIEKDPTLKNIVAKYENEIKVHVRLELELKSIVKQHEVKMKEKDDIIKELHQNIEVRVSYLVSEERSKNTSEEKF